MTEIYPKINETTETNAFRLQKINEINTYFENEIEHYREVLRKYKKAYSIIDNLNITSAVGTTALGIGNIGMVFILVTLPTLAPVVIPIEVVCAFKNDFHI